MDDDYVHLPYTDRMIEGLMRVADNHGFKTKVLMPAMCKRLCGSARKLTIDDVVFELEEAICDYCKWRGISPQARISLLTSSINDFLGVLISDKDQLHMAKARAHLRLAA